MRWQSGSADTAFTRAMVHECKPTAKSVGW